MKRLSQSTHAFIFNASKDALLFVKRRDIPVWVLPGGGVDAGETPEVGCAREAYEETGLSVEIEEKIGTYLPSNALTNIAHIYKCRITSGQCIITDETQDISFFSLDKLPKLPPPYPEWIADYRSNKPKPFLTKTQSVTYWALARNVLCHPVLTLKFLLTRCGIHLHGSG